MVDISHDVKKVMTSHRHRSSTIQLYKGATLLLLSTKRCMPWAGQRFAVSTVLQYSMQSPVFPEYE